MQKTGSKGLFKAFRRGIWGLGTRASIEGARESSTKRKSSNEGALSEAVPRPQGGRKFPNKMRELDKAEASTLPEAVNSRIR